MKKIVVNSVPLLSPLTGVGRYLFSILENIEQLDKVNKYYFYYGIGNTDKFFKRKPNFWEISPWSKFSIIVKYSIPGVKSIFNFFMINKFLHTSFGYKTERFVKRFIKFYLRSLFHYDKNHYDIYFEPNFIPLDEIKAKKIVTTVHDFSFHLYPQWHPEDRVLFFRKNFWRNIYKSDIIVTVTHCVKEEAKRLLKGYKGEIVTIYNGYDKNKFCLIEKSVLQEYRNKKNLPENFLLFVGSVEPRKNLLGLLKAYSLLPEYIRKDIKLLIVGFRGWKNKEVMQIISKLKNDIFYIGYVDDFELPLLYNLALASIYPSFYEGFGLPNIEAMACGCPVVTSDIPSIKEICHDAVYYVNPHDIESIKDGIIKIVEDEKIRETLKAKGLKHVEKYSWKESAKKHIELFNKL